MKKMNWLGNSDYDSADEVESLSYPPSGGRVKLILLGLVLPLVIGYFGIRAWITEEAVWFGNRNSNITVHGRAAQALAVTYVSAALFCHFRWYWGLVPVYRVFEIGTAVSLIGVIGGFGFGAYYLFT